MKRTHCLFTLLISLIFSSYSSFAQTVLRGMVMDAETALPVEMATVQLLRQNSGQLISYALTDEKGAFTLSTTQTDEPLEIVISLLGYETKKIVAETNKNMLITLTPKVFAIREVEVRPGRVWGNRDTINYDVSQFISPKDDSIKDVIRKLPGIDVDDVGRISYNGKHISNLYVEGMDISDSRYGQITNNLDAKAVEKVQLLENHQPIRILKDKVNTEDIAINLKLKEDFKDKWMVTLQGGAGLSESSVLWDANLYAMQLGRKSQSVYGYKSNNRGVDVTEEMMELGQLSFYQTQEPAVPSFLSMPSFSAPLKQEKMLFNDTHTLSANRLYKLNETMQLRINAGYVYDERKQEEGSETTYFQIGDTVSVTEQRHARLRNERGELKLTLENNADSHYMSNRFTTSGEWGRSFDQYSTERLIKQAMKRTDLMLKNDFKTNWNRGAYTYEVRSFLRFHHLPSELTVDGMKERLPINQFYGDHSFSLIRKKGIVSHRYSAGIKGEANTIENGYTPYATAHWQIDYRKWQTNLTLPVTFTHYPGIDFSRFQGSPLLYIRYKYNYAWQFSLSASYREAYGDVISLYDRPYHTNYRHIRQQIGELPIRRTQGYNLYGEYKNTVNEFFATLTLSHSRNWSNQTYEQIVDQQQTLLLAHKISNQGEGWGVRGTLSKGFYDWNMKTSLDYQFSTQESEMISQGERLSSQMRFMQYEPKITWSPTRRWEAAYQGNFRYGGNKIGGNRLSPLWNVVQKLSVSYALFPIEFNLSADHYYNDIDKRKSVHAFFLDAALRWKTASWQFDFILSNLFDKKQYSYTQYNALQSYTSWIHIRGREALISARYKF